MIFIYMSISDIDNQLKLQKTKLNIATYTDEKVAIQNKIKILNYKREIERIKGLIDQLRD